MHKMEQMDELILKVQKNAELKKEIIAVLQTVNPEDTTNADKWLADNGYEFTLKELIEHMEDGIPLSDERLESVAGGRSEAAAITGSVFATAGTAVMIFAGGLLGLSFCGDMRENAN